MKVDPPNEPGAKEQVRQLLDRLPESVSLEDIQYHIYVREKAARGIRDAEEGRVVTEEEFDRRMSLWLSP